MVGIQYNNISNSSQKCRFPNFQCKFPEVKQADYQEGQQHGTARGLEFTSHRHVNARAHLQTAFGTDVFNLMYTYVISGPRIWSGMHVFGVQGAHVHKSRGALTEDIWCARKHRRAPARGGVHIDRVACTLCCRENVVSSFRQEWDVCLSRETKYEKQLHQVQCFKSYFKSPTSPLHRIPTIRRAIVCNPEKLHIGVLAFCRW